MTSVRLPCPLCDGCGETVLDELAARALFDALIDKWHNQPSGQPRLPLHLYLGWTREQYAAYVERGELPSKAAEPILAIETSAGTIEVVGDASVPRDSFRLRQR